MKLRVMLILFISLLTTGCFDGQQAQVINPSREYFVDSSGGLYEINRGSGSPTLSKIVTFESKEPKSFSETQQWPFFGTYLSVSFKSKMINDRLFYQLSLEPMVDPLTGEMTFIDEKLRSKISESSSINMLFQDIGGYVIEEKRIPISGSVGTLDSMIDGHFSALTKKDNFNINSYLQTSPLIHVTMTFYGTN